MSEQDSALTSIAIVGMSGRFPGAASVDAFWQNLRDGIESVEFFSDDEVLRSGVSPAMLRDPSYVKARGVFDGAEVFDADFFGYNPREAAIMDPQQRLFLECAWESLEHAGYNPGTYPGLIGVFGGVSMNTYLLSNLYPNRELIGMVGDFQALIGNDKDYLTTRVSYKLDLKGPAVTVQTACSTSLVAISLACQSLLQYQCDMALAGGSSIGVPQRGGYLYQEGGIGSPDGHCRAFDKDAHGTVGGDGVGVVVLKRLDDALEDGDTIHAVITGFAINNDGATKAGYTAPSVQGQVQVIEAAQSMADADPSTIGYIEAHGTATPLGDPIEIAALTQVFRERTNSTGFCAIGSVKTNIGHLNAAAGVAGLIKTVMALRHKRIPPSLHFRQPNPQIDFANSPFFVNSRLLPWPARGGPRRAGVSSFGIGGTNAHVIVEEAPQLAPSGASRDWQLLLISARSAAALETATANLAAFLEQDVNLADVAYTLQVGRAAFTHRRVLLCRDRDDARRALAERDRGRLLTRAQNDQQRPVAFLFPGGGAQHLAMAADLYRSEPSFQQEFDRCAELLRPHLHLDLREVLYPDQAQDESAARYLRQTAIALPALFTVEYALAQLWISWGVRPQALIGHSLGEYVAACLAGVFSLEDALALVALRGRLMQQLQPGAMLSVAAPHAEIEALLHSEGVRQVSLAAINGPALCVVSGTVAAIAELETTLVARGITVRQLHIDVAAHSALVEPILGRFTSFVRTLRLQSPQLPFLSNVTGTWATVADATDPDYWARHLRETVRFADGLRTLLAEPSLALLEVGPSQTLSTVAKMQASPDRIILPSMRHPQDQQPDDAVVLSTLAQLWLAGVAVDWSRFSAHERRRRLPLPTYPFERQRYWVDPPAFAPSTSDQRDLLHLPPVAVAAEQPFAWEQAGLHPRPHLPNDYVAPRDETEQVIAGVWQQLLGIEPIGVEDNFFALGGHSLLATQIVARVAEVCRVELSLRTLFETPTIAGLAEQVTLAARETQPLQPIQPISRANALPLSFAQQRLWFIDQLAQGTSAYNIPSAVRLHGRLDTSALARSLDEVTRRHEILRTTFALVDGAPAQVVAPHNPIGLAVVDLRELSPPEREAEAQRRATIEAQRPFDLQHGPLVRASLMQLADDEHVLMLTLHHIVADEWSIGVLIRELTVLYDALRVGASSPLAPLPIQYADWSAWQREWLQGAVLDTQLSYWRQQLADAPVLQLPTDRPRAPVGTFRGTNQPFTLPLALADALRALSQREGTTLFMTMLAAFQTLLSRYSGQGDIVVSSGVANRRRPELESLIGCFINILVLRVDMSDRPRFRELLGRVREVCLQAYAHQDLPFELLVESLHPERDLSYNPLAQVMFIVQNAPVEIRDLPGLRVEPVVLFERAAAQFDLTMHVWEYPEGLRGIVEYNTDLFDAATIQRMLGHFQVLLEALVADPDRRTSELPLLTAAERQQMLVEWNRTQTAFPHDRCLHELFEAHVARDPEAAALIVDAWQPQSRVQRLSYGELNRRAERLAAHLRTLGVGADVPVGLYAERSVELVVGMLGILKAGGAYVPLDPDYPRERLAMMLRDSRAPVLVTQRHLDNWIALVSSDQHESPVAVYLDDELPPLTGRSRASAATTPEHLAYVIYTSGSTGRPKGIAIRHRGILNNIVDLNERFAVGPDDRVLALSSISFDMSVYEVLGTLAAGATIVMPSANVAREPDCWADLLVRHQVTVWNSAPPLLKILVDHVTDLAPLHPRWLRLAILGGDWVPVTLPDQLKALAPDVRVISLGGATEASIHSTIFPVDVADPGWRSIPYGWPMANQRIYVLDANLQPVPIGVAGELHLAGVGLARGYFNRPDLTAAKFIPNPFIADDSDLDPADRLYKTGDMVRYLPDGNTELLGRIDHLVKIRGFRIELGEIKSILERHPAVREAVVVVRDDGAVGKQLVAYVVGEPGDREPRTKNQEPGDGAREQGNKAAHRSENQEPVDDADGSQFLVLGSTDSSQFSVLGSLELRSHLKQHLPDYMVPSAFVWLAALPLSPNGKIDRLALPAPEQESDDAKQTPVTPLTPIQELIAGIWADVLGLDHVALHDNFFDVGGHSLLATQVLSRVRAVLGIALPLRELFESPTVAGMVERIAAARQAGQGWTPPPLQPAARSGAVPLSFAQQRLWFLHQLQPDSPSYNVPIAVRLSGRLDLAALAHSFNELVRRHEALRTTFVEVAGQPHQVIAPADQAVAVELLATDLRALPAAEREQAARAYAERNVRRPFDLLRGPLLHAALLRLQDQEHVLVLTLHHIVADGWSLGVLIREIAALYQAHVDGTIANLAALPVQYADYAVWQRAWMQGDPLEAQLSYWRAKLVGMPPSLELPTDRPRPALQTFRGAVHTFTLPTDLSGELVALSRREGVTLFMTLLAAWQMLLARYSGQRDIVVGTPIAGRSQHETEALIGCFINTLVLRSDLGGSPTFRELLHRVREACLDAYAHQDLPFELLVEALQPERDLSRHPLIQVLFALQNAPMPTLDVPGLRLRPLDVSSGTARLDLALSMVETADGLVGGLEYNTDLFDAATAARLAAHFQTLLQSAVAAPEQRVADLPLLSAAERQMLLHDWNATALPGVGDLCVHTLFEQQAARTPDAVAVSFAGQPEATLSYAELNRRANQVAHFLQAAGVGPEVRVGLCVERSLDLVVGLLGILKAGGAYVPLDPQYPLDRLRFMLEDAQAPIVLTQQHLAAGLTQTETRLVFLDADWPTIARCSTSDPASERPGSVTPDNLCYVIYTSGSTGRPKGVLLNHRGLSSFMATTVETMQIDVGSRVLQFASFSFDASLWEMFVALLGGGTVVLASRDDLLPGPDLLRLLHDEQITVAHLSPSVLASMTTIELPHLHTLGTGTERCSGEVVAHWAPGRRFFNAYGPTETTIYSTLQFCTGLYPQGPPIGRPIANSQVYILDAQMQPVPIGVAGELYIGGVGVGRGYLDRAALTAERFVPDPFGTTPGARLYKSGDLARYLADGTIAYLGRGDQQIKLRGFRIELGEIEAALSQHAHVREALVQVWETTPDQKRLVAYVIPEAGQTLDMGELRSFIAAKLPDYMLPSAWIALPALPLTSNGKVDRQALPLPGDSRDQLGEAFVAPRTPIEEQLARIWAEVLGVERVGVHDNFFELGGHSLLAAQVISRVRGAFGPAITLRTLFEQPTVAGLSEALSRQPSDQSEPEDDEIMLVARGDQSLDQLLGELEQLSDDTIRSLLAGEIQVTDVPSSQEPS